MHILSNKKYYLITDLKMKIFKHNFTIKYYNLFMIINHLSSTKYKLETKIIIKK